MVVTPTLSLLPMQADSQRTNTLLEPARTSLEQTLTLQVAHILWFANITMKANRLGQRGQTHLSLRVISPMG